MGRFSGPNQVRGREGWFYGLRIRHTEDDQGSRVTFDVFEPGGQSIRGLEASGYRTTTLARKMGDKRRGYQHVARSAIDASPGAEPKG